MLRNKRRFDISLHHSLNDQTGMCINFNSMMVLIFILRYTITLMRKMGLASKLPLDHHVYLHKFTGVLIFVQAWLHTIAHLINFGKYCWNSSTVKPELITTSE